MPGARGNRAMHNSRQLVRPVLGFHQVVTAGVSTVARNRARELLVDGLYWPDGPGVRLAAADPAR